MGKMRRESLRPKTGVFVYLNRQIEGEKRWGIGERWREMKKGWGKIEERLRNLYVSL